MWTGVVLAGIGLFLVVFRWFLPTRVLPVTYRGVTNPDAALVMGLLVVTVGLVIAGVAVVARLKGPH
jgi:hypothetical protein